MTAERWLARAGQSVRAAAMISGEGDYNAACSRACYAMVYAARAALIAVGQPARAKARSHAGLIGAFSEFLVRPGVIKLSVARTIGFEQNRRLLADYEGEDMSTEDARAAIDHAEAFVSAVSASITRHRL